ncbi:MAG TPA: serine/threonine-protein kinase [Kofleriaceae bacterium]|nr:serine/threonine-protein kinase [Kofleriaceae bacterium]
MQRIGRYDVVRELGRGGMGAVYLATDPELQRSVALKLLHRGDGRARFRSEARALAALNHAGIVTIYEIGDHEGQQFIAMEFLDGKSLRELLEDRAQRPSRERLIAICCEVARAVAAAHAAAILHRDIKPENVVVGVRGSVKVVDFGIARRLDDQSLPSLDPQARAAAVIDAFTQTLQMTPSMLATARGVARPSDTVATEATQATEASHTVFGTPAYMAPEVLHGDGSTPASDVYSLGVMLYECLAGQRPFAAPNLAELILAIVGDAPPPRLADPLEGLVMRMLAREPRDRPTLAEVIRALDGSVQRRSRTRRSLVAATVISALATGGVFWLTRDEAPAATPAVQPVRIAVQEVEAVLATYGEGAIPREVLGDVITTLLREYDGVSVVSTNDLITAKLAAGDSTEAAAARRLDADWIVRGKLDETAGSVHGALELVELATGRVLRVEASGTPNELAPVLAKLAAQIANRLQPTARTKGSPRALAVRLYQDGAPRLTGMWLASRVYLEQAVYADPQLFDAWQALAMVRGWSVAPHELTVQAIDRTIALAPDDKTRDLWRGARAFYDYKFRDAIVRLARFEHDTTLTRAQNDLLEYYLGEAYFHDGQFKRAMDHFRPIVERSNPFPHAVVHAGEYALARRDFDRATRYKLGYASSAPIDLARGLYSEVATTDKSPYNAYAYVLMDTPVPPAVEQAMPVYHQQLHRLATATSSADIEREFEGLWQMIENGSPNAAFQSFQMVFEIMLVHEHADALRKMLAWSAKHQDVLFGHDRFVALAMPITKEPTRCRRPLLTTRADLVADAMEAEVAGDHRRAIEILRGLVDDPATFWDYPERAALIRNLRAIGDVAGARAVCEQLRQPAVFRWAWIPLHRICETLPAR